jgi:hypothetical protein
MVTGKQIFGMLNELRGGILYSDRKIRMWLLNELQGES